MLPDHVHEVARRAVDTLSEPGFEFPGEGREGIKTVPEDLKAELEEPLAELTTALDAVRRGRRKFNDSLRRKRLAIAEFDRIYSIVADWLKAMYRAAGLDVLADRVRPTIPRASKASDDKVVDDGSAGEGSPEGAGAAAPDAAEASSAEGEPAAETPTAEASTATAEEAV